MNGLKTVSVLRELQVSDRVIDPNGSGTATYQYTSLDPTWLVNNLFNNAQITNDTKIIVKRAYVESSYFNNGQFPIFCEVTRLISRTDQTLTLQTLIGSDIILSDNASVQPVLWSFQPFTVGNDFRRNFKIISQKQRTLQPLRHISVTTSINRRYLHKSITRDQEGGRLSAPTLTYRRGDPITMVRFWGFPYQFVGLDPANRYIKLLPVNVTALERDYYSYYIMGDERPTTLMSNGTNILQPYGSNAPVNRVTTHTHMVAPGRLSATYGDGRPVEVTAWPPGQA